MGEKTMEALITFLLSLLMGTAVALLGMGVGVLLSLVLPLSVFECSVLVLLGFVVIETGSG